MADKDSHKITRRGLIQTTLAAAAVGAVGAQLGIGSTEAEALGVPFLPYTADSFFKSSVLGAPTDVARTAAFKSFMATFPDQRATPYPNVNGVGTSKWGTAYAEGSATDPVWKLTGTVPVKAALLKTQGFHAPEWLGAMFSGTNDSPFCVVDRASGFTVFGGNAVSVGNHVISVKSAGLTYHASNGLDYRNPRSTDKRNFQSRGRIPDAMVIRRDLVDQGIVNGTGLGHTLHMFLCATNANTNPPFCHPMVGTESRHIEGWGAEGERIAIRPDVNVAARGLSPFGLVIARTLQQHGTYIGDNAGSASAVKAEQVSASRNPWAGLTVAKDALKGITWNDFFVLPFGWQ